MTMKTDQKKLGFGCMRLPLQNRQDQTSFDTEQLNAMVDRFLQAGFTYFDTAYTYPVSYTHLTLPTTTRV